ncbi:MAG: hypothetical protein WBG62_07930, partial [Cyclobacteriaceae bacterium]
CSKRLRRKPVFFNKKRSLKLQQISLERKSKGCLNTFETASFLFSRAVVQGRELPATIQVCRRLYTAKLTD